MSTFVVFELLLKPFLYGLMGHAYTPRLSVAELACDVAVKKGERQTTIPVVFSEPSVVVPLEYHGSAHIHAVARAEGLLMIPAGVRELTKGSRVHVRPI